MEVRRGSRAQVELPSQKARQAGQHDRLGGEHAIPRRLLDGTGVLDAGVQDVAEQPVHVAVERRIGDVALGRVVAGMFDPGAA